MWQTAPNIYTVQIGKALEVPWCHGKAFIDWTKELEEILCFAFSIFVCMHMNYSLTSTKTKLTEKKTVSIAKRRQEYMEWHLTLKAYGFWDSHSDTTMHMTHHNTIYKETEKEKKRRSMSKKSERTIQYTINVYREKS